MNINAGTKPTPFVYNISPLSYLSLLDWQQCRRIRQTSQDHREKVKEDKILQVFAPLGCSPLVFTTLAWLCCFGGLLPPGHPGSSGGSSGNIWRAIMLAEAHGFISGWDVWSADQKGINEEWGLILYIRSCKRLVRDRQHWFVAGPALVCSQVILLAFIIPCLLYTS